jgi:hypothetical protein
VAQTLEEDVYWQLLDSIPLDWKTPEAMTAFARFLRRFLDKNFAAIIIQRMDLINQAFLRLRSEGKPAWRAHCYGHFFPTGTDQVESTCIETEAARLSTSQLNAP